MNEVSEKDDINKLDILLKKLIDTKKISKKQLIQKLMQVSDSNEQTVEEDGLMNENILDGDSEDGSARVPALEASHRNQISNTNTSFYKFRSQEQLHNLQNERPKSSKGGLRSSMNQKAQQSQGAHQRATAGGKGTLAGHHQPKPETAENVSRMMAKEGNKMTHNSNGRNGKRFESQHNPSMQ